MMATKENSPPKNVQIDTIFKVKKSNKANPTRQRKIKDFDIDSIFKKRSESVKQNVPVVDVVEKNKCDTPATSRISVQRKPKLKNFDIESVFKTRTVRVENVQKEEYPEVTDLLDTDDSSTKCMNSNEIYAMNLNKTGKFVSLRQPGVYAMRDKKDDGMLSRSWIVVETVLFTCGNGKVSILICSCKDGKDQRSRIEGYAKAISEDKETFTKREVGQYCIHCNVCMKLLPEESAHMKEDSDDPESDIVDILCLTPFSAIVLSDMNGYGVIVAGQNRFKCQTCPISNCPHMNIFLQWNEKESAYEFDRSPQEEAVFKCVSKLKIPWPLPPDQKEKFAKQKLCTGFPKELEAQSHDLLSECEHGKSFMRQVICDNAIIHHEAAAVDGYVVYEHVTRTKCCKIQYDGSPHFLLNLDNKNMFPYEWLFGILKRQQETKYPIQAALRSAQGLREEMTISLPTSYYLLHKAFNCFIRLLEWDPKEDFSCNKCLEMQENGGRLTKIGDGIAMGCRRDLLTPLDNVKNLELPSKKPIIGTKHADRVLLKAPTRKLLSQYVCVASGRLVGKRTMPVEDFKLLLGKLKSDCLALHQWIFKMGPVPYDSCREFLAALASSSSLSGSFQGTLQPAVAEVLEKVLDGKLDITDSAHWESLHILQAQVPLVAKVISQSIQDRTVGEVRPVIKVILNIIKRIAETPIPDGDHYSPINDDKLEFFPCFPKTLGKGVYQADKDSMVKSTARDKKSKSECRKKTQKHPRLTPGLFTLFCDHGVCQGFTLMRDVESPKTLFDILTGRFTANIERETIIYDNCCSAFEYAMNREPGRFCNTMFLVDRMHYKGHTACSQGFSMDTYKGSSYINNINSQAVEQANALLRNLSKQVTFMSPSQVMLHTALFLAQNNRKKKGKQS